MNREEELNLIKKERDEMEKHMTDMFDLAFMLNNRNDVMNPQLHYEKLSRMVTHYMGSIQQSYGYMADKTIKALEQKPKIGKWKITHKSQGENHVTYNLHCYCTNCGFVHDFKDGHTAQYNYCPSCGAKMESEVNNG